MKKRPLGFLQLARKYSFTLMEVMIGFAIMSIVLGVIFSSLYQETILKTKIGKMEKPVMAQIEMQQRLDRVFANIILQDPQSNNKAIYTSGKNLYISFDNGIDPEPLFCDEVKGVLSIEKGNFVLTLLEEEPTARKITLRENVSSVSYEFLTNGKIGIESLSNWKDKNYSPSYVKITLNGNEEYAFWVNRPSEGIPLRGKG